MPHCLLVNVQLIILLYNGLWLLVNEVLYNILDFGHLMAASSLDIFTFLMCLSESFKPFHVMHKK